LVDNKRDYGYFQVRWQMMTTTLSVQDAFATDSPEVGVLCGLRGRCREATRFDCYGWIDVEAAEEESGYRLIDVERL